MAFAVLRSRPFVNGVLHTDSLVRIASLMVSTTVQPSQHQSNPWQRSISHKRCCSSQSTTLSEHVDDLDPHSYTSGRWLRCEKQELDARYINFDFDALCQRVVQLCPGASSINSYDKKEGGFNRVFLFVLDNGKRVVAKLPFSLAGPSRLLTNSEVATIKYLQSKTSIPIPTILDWNDDPLNDVGSEYIIAEHAEGIQLHQRWPTIPGDDRIKFVDSFCRMIKQMADIEFPAYGSLYFKGGLTNGENFLPLDNEFCIGPHCGSMFWDCSVAAPRNYNISAPNQGPWRNLTAYCDALVDTGISRIPCTGIGVEKWPRYHGSISEHLKLLEHARSTIKQIAKDSRIQNAASPILLHPDIHKRNIFVADDDPTRVTSIIDWQSTSIEPGFWHADETPDFAQVGTSSEACAQAFEVCTQYYLPQLAIPRFTGDALFRLFRYCHRTWRDGAVALRHELIEIARDWDKLGLPGSPPFPLPGPEEWASHQRDYRLFGAAQNLRRDLAHLIDVATDGWVPRDEMQRAKSAQREIYDCMLQAVLENKDPDPDEPVRTEADLREIWPFAL